MAEFAGTPTRGSFRRSPKQQRGRDRVEVILAVALKLIARDGVDAVTMKEIAALSGGPIASIYQYFPNKSAIIAALHNAYLSRIKTLLNEGVGKASKVTTSEDALALYERTFDLYHQYITEHPHTLHLMNAVQADKVLSTRDITAVRAQAASLFERMNHLVTEDRRQSFSDTLFIFCHAAASTIRLSFIVTSAEGDKIIAEFKSIAHMQLRQYFTGVHP
ncbi:TetR family transcriptional regulator [Rhizobium wenxiniae]|uniref:TetR family transcriptional regulator n=1 Tax=Rhizobium wenxiniae TaxID=1737357 RepID=UPI003C28AFDA